MKRNYVLLIVILIALVAIAISFFLLQGLNWVPSESGSYSCSYESRHTGCGGKEWSEWKAECYAFNMDDYKEGWTPEKVCGKYTGSDTNCEGGCCIDIEYMNNKLSRDRC